MKISKQDRARMLADVHDALDLIPEHPGDDPRAALRRLRRRHRAEDLVYRRKLRSASWAVAESTARLWWVSGRLALAQLRAWLRDSAPYRDDGAPPCAGHDPERPCWRWPALGHLSIREAMAQLAAHLGAWWRRGR